MLKSTIALGVLLVLSSVASADQKNPLEGSIMQKPSSKILMKTPSLAKNVSKDDLQYDSDSDDEKKVKQKKIASRSASKSSFRSFIESAWNSFIGLFTF